MSTRSFRPPESDAERAADSAAAKIRAYVRAELPLVKLQAIGIRVWFDFNDVRIVNEKKHRGIARAEDLEAGYRARQDDPLELWKWALMVQRGGFVDVVFDAASRERVIALQQRLFRVLHGEEQAGTIPAQPDAGETPLPPLAHPSPVRVTGTVRRRDYLAAAYGIPPKSRWDFSELEYSDLIRPLGFLVLISVTFFNGVTDLVNELFGLGLVAVMALLWFVLDRLKDRQENRKIAAEYPWLDQELTLEIAATGLTLGAAAGSERIPWTQVREYIDNEWGIKFSFSSEAPAPRVVVMKSWFAGDRQVVDALAFIHWRMLVDLLVRIDRHAEAVRASAAAVKAEPADDDAPVH